MHRIEAYVTLAVIFIIILSILYVPILFTLKKKGISPIRQLSYFGLGCSIFLILFATIFYVRITFSPEQYVLNVVPFQWLQEDGILPIDRFITEILPNLLMFVPFGFFLPIVFQKFRSFMKTTSIILLFTFTIEFCQYFIGRSSDIDDVIANLVGGLIGYLIYKIFSMLFRTYTWWNTLNDIKE